MKNPQNLRRRLFLGVILAVATLSVASAAERVLSPDGRVVVDFLLETDGTPAYQIAYLGKPLVLESSLGFEPGLTNGFQMTKSSNASHQGQWTNNFGERKIIPDNYHELTVDLQQQSGPDHAAHVPGLQRRRGVSLFVSPRQPDPAPWSSPSSGRNFACSRGLSVTRNTAPRASISACALPIFNPGANVPSLWNSPTASSRRWPRRTMKIIRACCCPVCRAFLARWSARWEAQPPTPSDPPASTLTTEDGPPRLLPAPPRRGGRSSSAKSPATFWSAIT